MTLVAQLRRLERVTRPTDPDLVAAMRWRWASVMHQFMDGADVAAAWDLTRRGAASDEPRILETQERLAACHCAMAHPENGTLVPARVQNGVLDPGENAELRRLLPIVGVRGRT